MSNQIINEYCVPLEGDAACSSTYPNLNEFGDNRYCCKDIDGTIKNLNTSVSKYQTDYTRANAEAQQAISKAVMFHQNAEELADNLQQLQQDINQHHDDKVNHIQKLKININDLNAINNTRKIQRSNLTEMNMSSYYFVNFLILVILICVFVFWGLISKNLKYGNASFQSLNSGLIATIIIIIIFGFLMVNAFWGKGVRDLMNKSSYIYKFPQF